MKCPACSNDLTAVTIEGVTIDFCKGSCGGIWFDYHEVEKFDRLNENVSFDVLKGEGGQNVVLDYNKPRRCPKCTGETLSRHFLDKQKEIEVDECGNCSGIWLDPGELNRLRHLNTDEDSRKKYLDDFFKNKAAQSVPARLRGVFQLLFK